MVTVTMNDDYQNIDPVGLLPKVFSGEATPAEITLVDRWREENSDNQAEYEAIRKLWDISGKGLQPGEIDVDDEWKRMESAIFPVQKGRTVLMRIMQIAASIVIISLLGLLAVKFTGSIKEKAPAASLSSVILPDGTSVYLNAGSVISYKKEFGEKHRILSLKGEAYFEVKSNPGIPFVISAGEAGVQVTGTKFNVRAYKRLEDIKVTVTEGSVTFFNHRQPENEITLHAGQTGIMNKTNHLVNSRPTGDMNDIAWKTGIIDLQDAPLHDVAEILINTYHARIEVDPAIRNCRVTVRFENRKLDAVLNVLRSTLDLKITRKGKRILISGKGC